MNMAKLSITCDGCGVEFSKRRADFNKERRKNPECKFYCTLSCHGKQNVTHLKKYNFSINSDLRKKASKAADGTNRKYHGRDLPLSILLRKCRGRRKEFSITIKDLSNLWDAQHGRCALSNIQLDLNSTSYITMPSVDRIDSNLGYVSGNIQFVSCALNLAKSTMSNDDALELIRLIRQSI